MANIRILDSEHGYTSREPDEDSEWDRGDTHTDHNFYGFEVVNDEAYRDLKVNFEPEVGRIYWLVAAIYSTGDSFGYDTGARVEYFDLYEDGEDADAAYAAIDAASADNPSGGVTYKNHAGASITLPYLPWYGYFESLDELRVYPVQLTR